MSIYRICAALLDYPTEELWQAQHEFIEVLDDDDQLTTEQKQLLIKFVQDYFSQPLLDAQSEYYQTFDVGYMTSLLLFEHVYGDSRERGQAMVDLMEQYSVAGIEIASKQLPDYLPLFLEYLSILPAEQGIAQLYEIAPILRLLALRLEKRQSRFVPVFNLLYALSKYHFDDQALKEKVQQETSDTTNAKLDKIWQEEQVRFQSSPTVEPLKTNSSTYYVNVGEDKRSQL